MPKFYVYVEQVFDSLYSVEADSKEEITIELLEKEGTVIEETVGWKRWGEIGDIDAEEDAGECNPVQAKAISFNEFSDIKELFRESGILEEVKEEGE